MHKVSAGSILKTIAALVLAASLSYSQEASAGITGRITDGTGGAIVGAFISVRDQQRGTSFPTKTNEDGIYVFPRLPVGNYEVRVESPGFKTFVASALTLEINQRARIDAQLEIGAVSENVQVTSEAALLQTDTTQVGSVINSRTIQNTPLLSQNFISLTLLTPGVSITDPSTLITGQRSTGGGRPQVNGNRAQSNNFLLDGVDNNQSTDNLVSYQPAPDAIGEFKLITNNAPAEFGNYQGGIINITIKSGTNQYHGDLFEFFRNDKLNANNWARNWQGTPRVPVRWNTFGGTIGGPVLRDRLFFFADYQGTRRDLPPAATSISSMPASFRSGDFSALLGLPRPIQLYNPYSVDAAGNRAPFAGNRIPLSLINSATRNILTNTTLYPLPTSSALRFNQVDGLGTIVNSDQGDLKLDYKPSDKDYFTARYSKALQDAPTIHTFPLINSLFNDAPFQQGMINWTRTFSPTIVNEFRAGVNNIMVHNGALNKLGDLGKAFGIAGLINGGLPRFTLSGGYLTQIGAQNIGTQQMFAATTFHYADNLTIVRGRHVMKAGGQLLRYWMNAFFAGTNGRSGTFTFNGQYTGIRSASAAFADADFFLGYPADVQLGVQTGPWAQRMNSYGTYFQDDWRATDTLTLNLGLRWEYHTPIVEVADRQANIEQYTGKLLLAGKDGNSRALYNAFKKDFQPRVGFAWTPQALGKKTVVRGAYSISSYFEGTGTAWRLTLNVPFNRETETRYIGQQAFGSTLDQGLSLLGSSVVASDPYRNLNLRMWDPNVRPANVQQWNLTVEEQLPMSSVLSVGYVGQHGTHLFAEIPYSQRVLQPDGTSLPSPYYAGNPLLYSAARTTGQASLANQKYNALQATWQKRMTHGLQAQVSYTFSKAMSDSPGFYGDTGQSGPAAALPQNLYNWHAEWGPSTFDMQHNMTASYTYELPIGKGRMVGNNMNKALNTIVGGWQMGGILSLHSGLPQTIQGTDVSGTGGLGPRADVVGNSAGSETVGPNGTWFNTAAFKNPSAGKFGNVGVGTVRGPGLKRIDLSLQKEFAITESKKFEVRADAYGLTNTPSYSGPDRLVTSATFGQITASQGERNMQIALKFYF